MGFDTLPPWDAIPYFDTPIERLVQLPLGGAVKIVTANPRRVVLIMGVGAGGGIWSASTNSNVSNNNGIAVSNTFGPLVITAKDHGPLVAMDWYGASSSGANITVIEITLRDWPYSTGYGQGG